MRTIRTGLFTSLDGIVDADDDCQFAYFDEELMREIYATASTASTAPTTC